MSYDETTASLLRENAQLKKSLAATQFILGQILAHDPTFRSAGPSVETASEPLYEEAKPGPDGRGAHVIIPSDLLSSVPEPRADETPVVPRWHVSGYRASGGFCVTEERPSLSGEWVKYADHEAALQSRAQASDARIEACAADFREFFAKRVYLQTGVHWHDDIEKILRKHFGAAAGKAREQSQ